MREEREKKKEEEKKSGANHAFGAAHLFHLT
jgi:hypothetical protein